MIASVVYVPGGQLEWAWSTDGSAPAIARADAMTCFRMLDMLLAEHGPATLVSDALMPPAVVGVLFWLADQHGAEHQEWFGYEKAVDLLVDARRHAAHV